MSEAMRGEMRFEMVGVYTPQPGDVVIVRPRGDAPFRFPKDIRGEIAETLTGALPDFVKVVVLADNVEMSVVREDCATQ